MAVPLEVESSHRNEAVSAVATDAKTPEPASLAPVRPPVPVTLITGCLGAGKSTLINRILTTQHGLRCAVIMNEFGESADMEKALIKEPEDTSASPLKNWVQLENGCICCTVKSNMVRALEELLQQRDGFDAILIETTGLANPGPVASALWTDAELEAGVCLDAVVTVVDARNARRQLGEGAGAEAPVPAALQQVAFADVILLNKVDELPADQADDLAADLARVNAAARIVRCVRCDVDLRAVLRTGIYGADGRPAPQEPLDEPSTGYGHGHAHEHHAHGHHWHALPEVRAVTLRVSAPVSLARVEAWMDRLLWDGGETEVYRVKAVLQVAGEPRRQVLQAVYDVYEVRPAAPWAPDETPGTKVVVIGHRLDEQAMQRDLEACCAGL